MPIINSKFAGFWRLTSHQKVYIQDKTSIFVQSDLDLLCSHRVVISEIQLQSINQWSIQPDYLISLIIIHGERESARETDKKCRVSLFFWKHHTDKDDSKVMIVDLPI